MRHLSEPLERRTLFETTPLPDLVGVSIAAAPGNYLPGDAIRVLGSVRNIGDAPFPDVFRTIRVFLSTAPQFGQGTDVLFGRFPLGEIAPGAEARFNDFLSLPDDLTPGPYYVTALIDPDGVVTQSRTDNDTFASTSASVLFSNSTLPAPDDVNLDPRFGDGGALRVALNNRPFATTSTIVDNRGRFLIVGSILNDPNESGFFRSALVRVLPTGQLDTSFGIGGVVFTDLLSGNLGRPIAVTPDDKILLTASQDDSLSINDPLQLNLAVARFNDDGSVDTAFGTNGKTVVDFVPTFRPGLTLGEVRNTPNSLALSPTGQVYVSFTVTLGQGRGRDLALARFTPAGQLDTSFNNGAGATNVDIAGNDENGVALALQKDGKIVVVGDTSQSNGDSTILATRFLPTGALDESFAQQGRFFSGPTGPLTGAHGVAIQRDNKIVIAGSANMGSLEAGDARSPLLTLRLTPKGKRDQSFGTNGAVTTDIPNFTNTSANDVFLDQDGRILVSGLIARSVADFINDRTGLVITRYDRQGRLDTTFADNGIATLFLPPTPQPPAPSLSPQSSALSPSPRPAPGDEFDDFIRRGAAVVAVTPAGGVFAIATSVSPDQTQTVITIESVAADSPDLAAALSRRNPTRPVPPNSRTTATLRLTNTGSTRARGRVTVTLTLSPTPDATTPTLLLTTTTNVNLASRRSRTTALRFTLPDATTGPQFLIVTLTPTLPDPDPRNNTAFTAITFA